MIEQEKVNKARIWGYATGLVVFLVVVVWKLMIR
jgi:hypothetical protein